MIIRRAVVLSGIDSRLLEKTKPILSSRQITVISEKMQDNIGSYVDSLLSRTNSELSKISSGGNCKIIAMVASFLNDDYDISVETRTFFPILRRLSLPYSWRSDINRYNEIADRITATFKSEDFGKLSYSFKKPLDDTLLLPHINCNCQQLTNEFISIYNMHQSNLSSKINKYVNRIKKTKALNIKGVQFEGCLNNESHPVRRCSDDAWCDIAAQFRFGFEVPSRFEFDVTASNGIAGKTFHLCNGTAQKIPSHADHLNMRINGDYKW